MRVLVCGGRDYTNYEVVSRELSKLENVEVIIHGQARGADKLAGRWAKENDIPVEAYPADWDKYGKGAGPIRNQQMLDEGKPDLVVAFPGGPGTMDMCERADKAGVKVYKVIHVP